MSDNEQTPQPYQESEGHVPDPTAMTGTLETSGVGGGHHSRLEGVVGVFRHLLHPVVERHGQAEHSAPIVQGDTTGIPAPTVGNAPGSESADPEGVVKANDGAPSEVTDDPSAPAENEDPSVDESDKGDDGQGTKAPAGRRATKKAASVPDATKK